jgi:hypothetical protein
VELPEEERGVDEGFDTVPLGLGAEDGLETVPPDWGELEGLLTVSLERGAAGAAAPVDRGAVEGLATVPLDRSDEGAAVRSSPPDGRLGTIRAPPILSITRRGTGAVRSGESTRPDSPAGRVGAAFRQSEDSFARGAVPVLGAVGRARQPSSLWS